MDDDLFEEVLLAPEILSERNIQGRLHNSPCEGIDLDPIEEVGSINVPLLFQAASRLGFHQIESLLRILVQPEAFLRECVNVELEAAKACAPPPHHLSEKNIERIKDWGLLVKERTKSRIRAFCSLFSVPKSNGKARLIFNGKVGNRLLRRPPHFELFGPAELLRKVFSFKQFFAASLDIRHQDLVELLS